MTGYKNFLVLCAVLLSAEICDVSAGGSSSHSVQTSKLIPEAVAKFKLDLHHSLQSARIRKKRETGLLGALTDENAFVKEHLRVESYAPEDLSYLADYNLTFWTSVFHHGKNGVLIGTAKGDLVLFELQNRVATTVARSTGEEIGYKAKAFSHYDEQWFAILQPTSQETYIRLYKRVGRGIERRQTIVLEGESDFDLVTVRGVHYLAVATYKSKTSQGYTYQAHVTLYHWTRTQFDAIAARSTYGARSLACWALDGSLYLSVAQETNDDRNLYLGSPVFMYNAKEASNLVLIETLSTKAPRKCAHFFVSGSHYLIFIGQFEGVIYWWAGNQFLEWQVIPRLAGAVDVSVLSLLNGEVIIAVALKEEILFLTLDSAGYYTVTLTMSFSQFSIRSLQFMWDSKDYFALALFEASLRVLPHPTWRLNLGTYRLPKDAAMDPLLLCLYRLQGHLEERQSEIERFNSRIDKVWLLDKDQEITRNVIINGSVSSEGGGVDIVQITSTETAVSPWSSSNISEEIAKLSNIEGSVKSLIGNSLQKSTDQTIRGVKNFTGLLETPLFAVKNLPSEFILNCVPTSELIAKTLKTSGHQNFTGMLHLKGLSVETADVSLVNGLDSRDFLRLKGEQLVKGSLYFSDVRAVDIVTGPKGVINSIQVDKFITAHTDQEIKGLKSFSLLKSEVIDVHGNTNGEDLTVISEKIITVDRDGEISGNLEFKNAVDIGGDLFLLGLVNNFVNISHLVHKGVDKYSSQEITGSKTFHSSVYVNGDLHLEGTINGIDLDKEVITLSTDQEITGNLKFSSPLTFEKDVVTDLVNGVDLDTRAVIRKDDQYIEGHKMFSSHLTCDEIKMGEGITLDSVDPSELAKALVQHENGIVKDDVVISNAVILGNLIATEGINSFPINDLPDTAYLKSKPQEIKVPVFFPGLVIAEDLEVTKVNDLDLDTDVVHSFGDEEILSTKEFPDVIHVENEVSVEQGKLFGGADISSFGDIDLVPEESAIRGVKVIQLLEVKGNIEADFINGIDFSGDLMLKDKPQRVPGSKTFKSGIISGELQARNVIPGIVNGENFTEFTYNAVLRSPSDSREIKNKTFYELTASSLHIPARGRIDGVYIPEMLLKAVTLNTSQYITSDKTFTGSLQFLSPMSASRVNDLDLVSHIHSVIFKDTEEVIRGRKTVHGDVHVSDLIVRNLLNGVNVGSLSRNAVYKSKRNEISAPMIFSSDLTIGSLLVENRARIDGISMEDLVLLHENANLNSAELHTNLFVPGNINVSGLVNGCDLSKVLKEAVKLGGTEQLLTGDVELKSLNVTGSVTFRDTVSGIAVKDLFKVVTRSGRVINGNFHFNSGISARSLHIKGPIEGVDLAYIIRDAVRKSVPQVITSKKLFKEDLEIEILDGKDGIFVTETVNGVNLRELWEKVVWKDGFQVIDGEKIFSSLHIYNATVLGYLNGLRLPRDVVLTYTSDRINGSVHLMKDLEIESHLMVHGRIDGVHLNSFLDRRVTLEAEEELAGQVTFKKDLTVKGDMVIDGMINDVVLEMAVKSHQDNEIHGIKQFKDLAVHGYLSSAFINGYNLTELLNSLLRLDDKEDLNGLQVFTQPIRFNAVVVDNVNGIALERLESTYLNVSNKLRAIENSFDGQNKLQQDQIATQMEATLYQISDFAYFVKVQELNFGSSDKIIIGHRVRSGENLFIQNMVLWTTRTTCSTPRKCCDSVFSYWLVADDEGYVTARMEPEEGRYIPFVGPNLFPTDGNFVAWTNTTVEQTAWCYSGIHETTEIGHVESGSFKVLLTMKNSPLLTDLKTFREGKLYAVAGYYFEKRSGEYSSSVVYSYNDMTKKWTQHQILSAYGVLAMDITFFKTASNILLALGTGIGSYPNSALFLYRWNDTERMFVEMQRSPSDYVTNVLWVDIKNRKLLIVSSVEYWPGYGECSEGISGGQVNVYEYYSSLTWIQSIPLSGVVSVVSFQVAGETYLAAASRQMETVYILQWKGFSRFSVVQAIHSPGVRHLGTYRRQSYLFMTVASASGKSSVLKAVVRGKTYYQRSEEEFPIELSDAPNNLGSSQTGC